MRRAVLHTHTNRVSHRLLATSTVCLTVQCRNSNGTVHWPTPQPLRLNVSDCRVGQEFDESAIALGGSGSYEFRLDDTADRMQVQCRNSSAILRVKSFVSAFHSDVRFHMSARDTRNDSSWVKTLAVAHVRCNVTTAPPQFDRQRYDFTMHHCAPNKTRRVGRPMVVTGGEPLVRITLHGQGLLRLIFL